MIGLILGTGFAGGVIVDGRLYPGRNCGAGEFGMMRYLDSIYEHYCSGQFFTRQLGQTGAELYRRASDGDRRRRCIRRFGRHLGEGVKAILYAYDPDIWVNPSRAFRFLRSHVGFVIVRVQLPQVADVAVSGQASRSGVRGAALRRPAA
jgi:glucokinase